MPFDDDPRKRPIGACTARCLVIMEDRLAKGWAFGQANISWNHDVEYLGAEMCPGFRCNLVREISPSIEHGQEYAFNGQTWIESTLDKLNGLCKLREAF